MGECTSNELPTRPPVSQNMFVITTSALRNPTRRQAIRLDPEHAKRHGKNIPPCQVTNSSIQTVDFVPDPFMSILDCALGVPPSHQPSVARNFAPPIRVLPLLFSCLEEKRKQQASDHRVKKRGEKGGDDTYHSLLADTSRIRLAGPSSRRSSSMQTVT